MAMEDNRPLAGIRVLDFSRVFAGPLCTQQMADLGAEIIKIEHPERGDDTRSMRPPETGGEATFYLAANRNKQSVALDFTKPEGVKVIHALAEKCDVLVENFRKSVMLRRDLNYDAIKERHPHLIYCSVSAYGRSSPLADLPGYDPILQAESGLMSFSGEPGQDPLRHPLSIIDIYTSLYATQAVMGAILTRHRTGRGQFIDLALYDVALSVLTDIGSGYLNTGEEPIQRGNSRGSSVPNGLFHTQTDPLYIAVGNPGLWKRFAEGVLERPELVTDPPFNTREGRVGNRDALNALISEVFAQQPRDYWLEKIIGAGVPGGAVRTIAEALNAPETDARGMVAKVKHPTIDNLRLVASPIKYSETPVVDPVAPPLLGQHTDAVLTDLLDMSAADIVKLRDAGVIR